MRHDFPTQHPRELTADEAWALDQRLTKLARTESRRRLYLGESLSRMETHGAAQKLGFNDTGTYGYETIHKSKRWCDESRWLAKRLANLPILRDALLREQVSWSMAETLARAATPDTERALLAQARTETVRTMKARLATKREEPEPERSTVAAMVEQTDAWYFESTRILVAAIAETPSSDEFAEALLAEGMTRLIADIPKLELPYMAAFESHLQKHRAQMSVAREAQEAERDSKRARELAEAEAEAERWAGSGISNDPLAMDDDVVSQLRDFVAVDVAVSRGLRRLALAQTWDVLGFESLGHYARERLGMSEATARARIDLAYALDQYPQLEAAVIDGHVGLEAARMIGRIAEPYTIDAWIERAAERTLKQLREEVEAAGLLSRVTADRRLAAPPDDEALATVFELERAVLAGVVGAPQISVNADEDEDDAPLRRQPKVMIKLSMRDDLARLWRALERVYARVAPNGPPFVTFLCQCVWQSWGGSEARMASYEYLDVYLHERLRCGCPVCGRRDLTAHHIVFRSEGGGNERTNLEGICSRCHLEGVHRYYIKVTGQAPDRLRWELAGGRIVVEGRRKL